MVKKQVVKEFELKHVKISELKLDPSNPNRLTDKQKLALQGIMKTYGFLVPITVDKKTLRVIDGEHRIMAYKTLGYDQILAFVIDTAKQDHDKKILRQVLNKFHGTPDPEKDVDELGSIMQEEVGAAMLDEFLGIDAESLKEMSDGLAESGGLAEDKDDEVDKMRRITLYFTKFEFKEYREKFDRLMEEYQVSTETEVVKALLEHRESSL